MSFVISLEVGRRPAVGWRHDAGWRLFGGAEWYMVGVVVSCQRSQVVIPCSIVCLV